MATKSKSTTEGATAPVNPVFKFNALAFAGAQRLMEINFNAMQRYTDLGLAQAKAAAAVSGAKDLEGYYAQREQAAACVAEAMQADASAMAELGASYAAQMQELWQSQLNWSFDQRKPGA